MCGEEWRYKRPEAEKPIRCLFQSSQEIYWKSELGQWQWKGKENVQYKSNGVILQIENKQDLEAKYLLWGKVRH